MQTLKSGLILLMLTFFSGCSKHCDDLVLPPHSEEELNYFYYQPGDTLFFIDTIHATEHFLTCTYRNIHIDTSWMSDGWCIDDGNYLIRPVLFFRFSSDIPFYEQSYLHLKMGVNTSNDTLSWVEIPFLDQSGELYWRYYFRFNNQNQMLTELMSHHPVESMGNQRIQGKEYQDVYRLVYLSNPDGVEFFYDTLYYNQDGFLKFISSQHGYVLERIE